MHEWLILRCALLLLAFAIFLAISFIVDHRGDRRDAKAMSGNRHDTRQSAGTLALR